MDESIVRAAPLFAELGDQSYLAVRERMQESTYRRGEEIFREGSPGDRLYIIGAGKVKLGHTAPDGREHLLAILGPGEILGEVSLYDPGPRTATATALAKTTVVELQHTDLLRVLDARPEISQHLLRSLAIRLRRTNNKVSDLIFSDVPGRVSRALLDLGARFGQQTERGLRVTHDLTQEELAQLVGATRETVNKALAEFSSRGWLQLDGRSVVLLDIPKLRRRAR
ncbi:MULTISPECIES: Crp/Fnr family transcriptional regulator [unclassified Pseudactinotalea]|uniref:Crp/Fnr family transcriptional regulator n=1 Tax=unclassified Pseudactinotalea TaxID=2649176 RepID=UPI00128C564A|nr:MULTISPECIES: Crp/Fnr family transcriptional regulator [unclassified Pseudactinotalea]MPV48958.1 cyclic nucleotide-binding domain-containing protein [Pseudactinotalea sp. HY160]QGH68363.1 cyclic nucleotide-binding domain-containing protein [Pseudactinotalea sp. HY158]